VKLFVSYFLEMYSSDGRLTKSGFTYRVLEDTPEPQDDYEINAIVRKIRDSYETDDTMSVVPISWKALTGERT
jgi:hypothetical protein